MAITPGIPIPSAMPRVSLERPFNGADDGADEDVGDCGGSSTETMVDGVICEDNAVVADDITDEDAKIVKNDVAGIDTKNVELDVGVLEISVIFR